MRVRSGGQVLQLQAAHCRLAQERAIRYLLSGKHQGVTAAISHSPFVAFVQAFTYIDGCICFSFVFRDLTHCSRCCLYACTIMRYLDKVEFPGVCLRDNDVITIFIMSHSELSCGLVHLCETRRIFVLPDHGDSSLVS